MIKVRDGLGGYFTDAGEKGGVCMIHQRYQPAGTSPAGQSQGTDSGTNDLLKKILESVLKTREALSLLAEAIPVVLKICAGESGWNRIVSKAAAV